MNQHFTITKGNFTSIRKALVSGFAVSIAILLFFFFPAVVHAQSCISGQVTDANTHKPLPDANITVASGKGTTSDKSGNFQLCRLPSDTVTITVSYIGYETLVVRTKLIPGENKLSGISIIPTSLNMDEFVITATRTDNRMLNTPVRVNMITPKMLNSIPIQNIDHA